MTVETYSYKVRGKHVRFATQVVLSSGQVIKFMDKLSKKEALKQAVQFIERESKCLTV